MACNGLGEEAPSGRGDGAPTGLGEVAPNGRGEEGFEQDVPEAPRGES